MEEFLSYFKPIFGCRFDEIIAGLSHPKNHAFYLNSKRRIDYFAELSSSFDISPILNQAFIINSNKLALTETISFQTGGLYILNPASLAPCIALSNAIKGVEAPLILDMASAPGGKTFALSNMLPKSANIIANELSKSRLKALHFNLERCGCINVKTVSFDGRLFQSLTPEKFDAILLDAPCSNENKFMRNKKVQNNWNEAFIEKMASISKGLLSSAFKALKKGGTLIYSTCTLNLVENEIAIKELLENEEEAELLDVRELLKSETFFYDNIEYGLLGEDAIDQNVGRILPLDNVKHILDGFFLAAIRKKGELEERSPNFKRSKPNLSVATFLKEVLPNFDYSSYDFFEINNRGYISRDNGLKLRYERNGLNLYKKGKSLELASQALWELGAFCGNKDEISYDEALNYLKGFDILEKDNYNNGLLFFKDIPVGTSKLVGSVLKNKLDRYFLYGKNIEY